MRHPTKTRRHATSLTLLLLCSAQGAAQTPSLVLDVNPGLASAACPGGIERRLFPWCGGALVTLDDGRSGCELWKTDGTAAGTVMVKDINPGPAWGYPAYMTDVGGTVFFSATDSTNGTELWKTDGTAAGTVLVVDIAPGPGSSRPSSLINVDGTLFFTADDGNTGIELWKSDGTAAGTVMVKDIWPGGASSRPLNFHNLDGTLLFVAASSFNGRRLWRSDGTTAGTVLLKDMNTTSLVVSGGFVFFTGYEPVSMASGIWKTDGTPSGTVLVKNLSDPRHPIDVGGTVFFFNWDPTITGGALWKTDGSAGNTVLVKRGLYPFVQGSHPFAGAINMIARGNTLFFVADDGTNGDEIWKSDGTESTTVMVADINPGAGGIGRRSNYVSFLFDLNGTLFFQAEDGSSGQELWKTDGSSAGTTRVMDINPGPASAFRVTLPYITGPNFAPVWINSRVVFLADDGVHGGELWSFDAGSPATVGTGTIVDVGGGCGNGGTAGGRGSFSIGNPDFSFTLTGADPLASVGLFNLNLPVAPISCAPCQIMPPLVFIPRPIGLGNAEMPIGLPCNPSWVGITVQTQWWVLGTGPSPCFIAPLGLAFSNRSNGTIGS